MLATVSWMRVSSSGVSASSGCSGAAEGFSAGALCQGLSANPAQTPRARDSTKHARVSRMSRFFCMDPPPFCRMVIFILPHFADPVCPFFAKIFARFFREFYKRKNAAPLVGDAAFLLAHSCSSRKKGLRRVMAPPSAMVATTSVSPRSSMVARVSWQTRSRASKWFKMTPAIGRSWARM